MNMGGGGKRTWKEEHLPFLNPDILELLAINHTKKHTSLVLIKPFLHTPPIVYLSIQKREIERRRSIKREREREIIEMGGVVAYFSFVHVVVVALVGTAYGHDDVVFARVQAEVVHRGLQEVPVLGEPFGEVERGSEDHGDGGGGVALFG